MPLTLAGDGTVGGMDVGASTPIKAWVRFNPSGTISDSYNVSSVTDTAVGRWIVNFTTAFANTDYGVLLSYEATAGSNEVNLYVPTKAVGSCTIYGVTDGAAAYDDPAFITAMFLA